MDVKSIKRMILESDSEILVVIDVAFPKVRPIMQSINQEHIIIQSATTSLPPVKKALMKLKMKTSIPYSDKILTWNDFLACGKNTAAEEAPYVGDATVAIAYTQLTVYNVVYQLVCDRAQ